MKKALMVGIWVFILVGVGVYLYGMYQAGTSLKVEDVNIKSLDAMPPTSARIKAEVHFFNPTDNAIYVKNLLYRTYIEGKYVGEGYKIELPITPGKSKESFDYEFDMRDVFSAIKPKDMINITVRGKVDVPLKVFGLFTWKTITVPYQYNKTVIVSEELEKLWNVSVGKLPQLTPTTPPFTTPLLPTPSLTPTPATTETPTSTPISTPTVTPPPLIPSPPIQSLPTLPGGI